MRDRATIVASASIRRHHIPRGGRLRVSIAMVVDEPATGDGVRDSLESAHEPSILRDARPHAARSGACLPRESRVVPLLLGTIEGVLGIPKLHQQMVSRHTRKTLISIRPLPTAKATRKGTTR